MSVVACERCGTKSRVGAHPRGVPRCPKCKAPVPWTVDATEADFEAQVDAPVPVLVDLWAPWCGPCRMVTPILEQLARERAGRLKVVKVNVDESPRVSARYRVQGIPTLLLLDRGEVTDRQVGALPAAALSRWVDSHVSDDA